LEVRKRQEPNTLHYCVDARDPDFRSRARSAPHRIGAAAAAQGARDRRESGHRRISTISTASSSRTCDIYLGFKLIPDAYPDWLTVSRPIIGVSYVLAVTNPDGSRFRHAAIASDRETIGTSADLRLIQYREHRREPALGRRFSMGTDEAALRSVLRRQAGAALVGRPRCGRCRRTAGVYQAAADRVARRVGVDRGCGRGRSCRTSR